MKAAFYLSLILTTAVVVGHDGHDEVQMPLDYVRFPYQAQYPGDNTGEPLPTIDMFVCSRETQ